MAISSPGLEYLQNRGAPITYRNDLGQKTVYRGATIRNNDGSVHTAYKGMLGTEVGNLIEKQKRGFPLTPSEQRKVNDFWASDPTAGLQNINKFSGGGIISPNGFKKMTNLGI